MLNQALKDFVVDHLLPRVQTPSQYIGGEWNAVRAEWGAGCRTAAANKADSRAAPRGKLCLCFPDTYSIGMSCHAVQVLYDLMNRREGWACERAFAPMEDFERLLREHQRPLYGLETFTPLADFDVVGFTLQHDLCYTNVLTMLDLGGIPLAAEQRTIEHPLVIAGGPCAVNPEPMARFIDLFVIGDGEEALPEVCNLWAELKQSGGDRQRMLAEMAARLPYAYVPSLFDARGPGCQADRGASGCEANCGAGCQPATTRTIEPAIVADLNAFPPPVAPIVPYVECVQDRIAIEIMRGCPGKCRFCQSTTLKRPLRYRKVETIVQAAMEQYRNTGYNEISLLSLSSSDYPEFDELLRRLQETFRPLGVSISLPSLRINEQLRAVGELLNTDRHSGLTLAPEAAREEMRRRIGKPITDENLLAGCRRAFENGFSRVKLYFMCGLPGEQETDLEGIIELSEKISRLGKEVTSETGPGRYAEVVANVSNFVPKPQTPFQWHPMQRREYFRWAHDFLYQRNRYRSVKLRCHDVEASLLEGALCRGDRRMGEAIELAWSRGARFDAWSEKLRSELWWQAISDAGIDLEQTLHVPYLVEARLPWDHIGTHQGRGHLEREWRRAAEAAC
ncbi:MAG: TIGR03960 family B12-binding radical SAM protein [Planctomycetaceae bacterium]|nr:TIGR03960 family B12-binding radical SAM protein [Planctomycetaceae bacterium]